jgi:dolichol-phosphate mannosyltransferase
VPRPLPAAQAVVLAVLVGRLARGRRRRPPLAAGAPEPAGGVTVVVPARDEEERLGPCLAGLEGRDVLVVDDRSTDGTAALAARLGARVVPGAPLPAGWRGKTWALQQGLEASTGEWVVFLDADTRPRPGLVPAVVAGAGEYDVLSVGARFRCDGAAERLLHPAMAVTLPLRFGPGDVPGWQPRPGRAIANGQCVVVRREAFLRAGGWARVRGQLTEDVALARAVRHGGGTVGFADGADLLDVRMYGSAAETWRGWGRSLMATDATTPAAQAGDLAVLWLAMALPLPRLLLRRGTRLDALLLLIRLALHTALARSYRPRGVAYWLAPLSDGPVVGWLTWRALRPDRSWRGRTYET